MNADTDGISSSFILVVDTVPRSRRRRGRAAMGGPGTAARPSADGGPWHPACHLGRIVPIHLSHSSRSTPRLPWPKMLTSTVSGPTRRR